VFSGGKAGGFAGGFEGGIARGFAGGAGDGMLFVGEIDVGDGLLLVRDSGAGGEATSVAMVLDTRRMRSESKESALLNPCASLSHFEDRRNVRHKSVGTPGRRWC
jgi:hypothetical protein